MTQSVNPWPSAHRPSKCPDCGKTYRTMSGILAHLRTHKGDACLVYDDGTACRDHLPQPVWCANCTRDTTPGQEPS